jgi:hypothetical protein
MDLNIEFNKKKCLALISKSNKLRQQGKSLSDYDDAKNKELNHYLRLLEYEIFWNCRFLYLQVLENFIHESIEVEEFIQKFNSLRLSNIKALDMDMLQENLKNDIDFQLNPESRGFSRLIDSIFSMLELFDPERTLETDLEIDFENPELILYGIGEYFLKIDLKDNFLPKIQKYCKDFKSSYSISEFSYQKLFHI